LGFRVVFVDLFFGAASFLAGVGVLVATFFVTGFFFAAFFFVVAGDAG